MSGFRFVLEELFGSCLEVKMRNSVGVFVPGATLRNTYVMQDFERLLELDCGWTVMLLK